MDCEEVEITSFDDIIDIFDKGTVVWSKADPNYSDRLTMKLFYYGEVYKYYKDGPLTKMYWMKGEVPDFDERT